MKIDHSTVDKLSDLAKLEFSKQTKEDIIKELNNILSFIDKLNELDTAKVEPLIYMNDEVNTLRQDEVRLDISHEDAMKNAPKKDSDYFRAPKVLDKNNIASNLKT